MKIAIFQANTKDNKIDENLLRYRSILSKLDWDTDLLVLPEMFAAVYCTHLSLPTISRV